MCSLLQTSPLPRHAAPVVVTSSIQASSTQAPFPAQMAGNPVGAAPMQDTYPAEYDPFDRPVEEVVTQLFDDTQPVNPPPTKRQR